MHPLSEGWTSSTGSNEPFGPSAELIHARDYFWENANKLKSVFLANMSHEIRTPLNAVLGFSELLMMDENDPVKRDRLEIIGKSGRNLLTVIDDMLDFSKIEAGRLEIVHEVFSIRGVMDYLRYMFLPDAEKKDLIFDVKTIDAAPDAARGDQHRINQVLVNLLGNAFKFTTRGRVSLACSWKEGVATFTVSDTGSDGDRG